MAVCANGFHKLRNFAPYIFSTLSNNSILRYAQPCFVPFRGRKHWDPKFKKERAAKVQKVFLPNFQEERENAKLSVEEMRAKLKEKGICPTRQWNEKPLLISCSTDVFEPYVPPEGDGKISPVSSSGVKQMYEGIGKKGKSYMALRKIRNIDFEFDVPKVAERAKDIYIEAQEALVKKDEEKLHDLATEKAFPEMMENVKNKTLVWKFIQCLEPPRIVQIRVQDMLSKENTFAQVTVRLHTQQTLAIYDRFGRLLHGSEDDVKDVLEYLVFEKQITSINGLWRIHGKIIPDWLPPRDHVKKTCIIPDIETEFPEPPPSEEPPKEASKEQTEQPALAAS